MGWTAAAADTEGEPAEFYSETMPIARKQHRCCETGGIIFPGEQYFKVTGKWDGDVISYKRKLIVENFCKKHKINTYMGGLIEYMESECEWGKMPTHVVSEFNSVLAICGSKLRLSIPKE